jgi:hypothetical protein
MNNISGDISTEPIGGIFLLIILSTGSTICRKNSPTADTILLFALIMLNKDSHLKIK